MDGEAEMNSEDLQITTQRMFNGSASACDLFVKQGFRRMCDFVPFSDLKNLRLVCHSWNLVVRHHSRYYSSRALFRTNWIKNTSGFHLDSITKWTNLTLQYFPLHRNTLFATYWAHVAPFVKILNLEHLTVGCTQLGKIIYNCTTLESIKFVRIYFDCEEVLQDINEAGGVMDNVLERQEFPTIKVYCNHDSFEGQVIHPTLKSIIIFNTDSFPNCLLDLLEKKCQGTLETFFFDYNTTGNNANGIGVSPTSAQIQAHIIRICQRNRLTLKHFSWTRNNENGDILTTMGEDQGMNLTLTTLSVALQITESQRRHNIQEGPIPDLSFVTLIRSNISTLVEINLCSAPFTEALRRTLLDLLPQVTNLTRMKFQIEYFAGFRHNMARNVDIFGNCQNLRELMILDKTENVIPRRWEDHHHAWDPQPNNPGISLHHLNGMPMSIRQLTCVHRISQVQRITNAIQHPTLQMLTKLVIEDGTMIRDNIMQLIIVNLNLLEVLTVKHGRKLTDAGLTGLNSQDCATVVQCRSQGILLKEPKEPLPGAPIRHSLRDLIYIRELDFSHCVKISDISLCQAIRFPELEKLVLNSCKVTDFGLSWLAVHNPKLCTLKVKKNQAISYLGLNRLVSTSKSIRSIQTDEASTKRLAHMELFTEHPNFKDVVDCKGKSEQSRSYEVFDVRRKKNIKIRMDNFEI